MKKNVLLVLDLFTPYSTRSSTQLVHFSILYGLQKTCSDLFVIGLYNNYTDVSALKDFLEEQGFKYILKRQSFDFDNFGKTKQLIALLYERFFSFKFLSKEFKNMNFCPDIILSCIPSFESGFLGLRLSRYFKGVVFRTIWTDVLSFNGLNEHAKLPFKRLPFKYIEQTIIKSSSDIYYLGKTQCDFQKIAFKKYAKKMDYYYPSFFPYYDSENINKKIASMGKNTCIYFGSLDSGKRNLNELINLSKKTDGFNFYIKGYSRNEINLTTHNLTYVSFNDKKKRVDKLKEALEIESSSYISLVFLNSTGFSLPGKMFYYTNLMRPILIIKDGVFKDDIEKELSVTKRFLFCENKEDDILESLNKASKMSIAQSACDFFKPEERYKIFISSKNELK